MSDTLLIAIIAAVSAGSASALTAAVNIWLGSRRASNEDVQLGLDAMKAGLETTRAMALEINTSLEKAKNEIVRIERQAYSVLSENNRFRIIHGVDPAHSLESFRPLEDDKWQALVERLAGRTQ